MKTRLAILSILLILVALLIWRSRQHQPEQKEISGLKTDVPQNASQSASNTQPSAASTEEFPRTTEEIAASKKKIDDIKKTLGEQELNKWRTPIEFYGMVVDENTNAVSGVQIDFSCNDTSATGTSHYQTTSDANGLFSLKNAQGKLLVVRLAKQDYYTSRRDNDSFEYGDSHATPNPNSPVIFHLRKKGETEPLVIIDYPGFARISQLKHDGTPVELDLFQGAPVSAGSGQLKLELQRDLSDKNAKKFDWKLQITIGGGGLIATDEEFPFEAAKDGYQPSFIFDMPATNQNWQGQLKKNFYIRLPDDKYGCFELMFLAHNGVFTIHSAINPSGSRVLEPAP